MNLDLLNDLVLDETTKGMPPGVSMRLHDVGSMGWNLLRGDVPLPASFGFHPAFAWPLPGGRAKEAHRIIFSADEPAALRQIDADGQIAPAPRASPLDGRTLALRDDLFAHDALDRKSVV